jgi:hypothetical protein
MASIGTQCAYCGWRNEPGARMCGGCGRPLIASALSGVVPPGEAITDPEIQAVAQARPRSTPAMPGSAPRRPNTFGRVLLILGVILLVIACVCAGAWGLILRPSLHRQVDSAVRTQLNTMADQAGTALKEAIPLVQAQPGGQFDGTVDAAKVNQAIQASASGQNPVSNTHVSFADGQLKITFDANNQQNSISTVLATSSGRLVARDTTVTGQIALIESGPELESAINDALTRLPPDPQITSVTLADDELKYTLTAKTPVVTPK